MTTFTPCAGRGQQRAQRLVQRRVGDRAGGGVEQVLEVVQQHHHVRPAGNASSSASINPVGVSCGSWYRRTSRSAVSAGSSRHRSANRFAKLTGCAPGRAQIHDAVHRQLDPARRAAARSPAPFSSRHTIAVLPTPPRPTTVTSPDVLGSAGTRPSTRSPRAGPGNRSARSSAAGSRTSPAPALAGSGRSGCRRPPIPVAIRSRSFAAAAAGSATTRSCSAICARNSSHVLLDPLPARPRSRARGNSRSASANRNRSSRSTPSGWSELRPKDPQPRHTLIKVGSEVDVLPRRQPKRQPRIRVKPQRNDRLLVLQRPHPLVLAARSPADAVRGHHEKQAAGHP